MNTTATLYFFCGKMAAGKSTLAMQIAVEKNALLLSEDQLLSGLYPDEIVDVAGYVARAKKINSVFTPVVQGILSRGLSVVMDFPANTIRQRQWFQELIDTSGAHHELHHIVATDELCKSQLLQRARDNPERRKTDTIEMFEAINQYYQPVASKEGFVVVEHQR